MIQICPIGTIIIRAPPSHLPLWYHARFQPKPAYWLESDFAYIRDLTDQWAPIVWNGDLTDQWVPIVWNGYSYMGVDGNGHP